MTDLNEVDIEEGTVNVQVFNQTDAALAELRERYRELPDANTKEGYEFVKQGAKELTGYRTALDAERKRVKEPYLEASRIIDGEAKRITEELKAIEAPLKAAKQEVDERERRQKEERLARLREKVDHIKGYPSRARNMASHDISAMIDELDQIDTQRDFYELTDEAIKAQREALDELGSMYSRTLQYEQAMAEQEQARREKAEAERQRHIEDQINKIKMAPVKAIGKSATEIETVLEAWRDYQIPSQEFGDRFQEARNAQIETVDQLTQMLDQQIQVEKSQKIEPEPEPEPKPDPKPTEREAPEPEPGEAPKRVGRADWMDARLHREIHAWAETYDVGEDAIDSLIDILSNYL